MNKLQHTFNLLQDNDSIAGRGVTSIVIIIAAAVLGNLIGRAVAHRIDDSYSRYYARKFVGYLFFAAALLALAILWRPFAGRLGVVVGLAAAGLAIALQEVIASFAGWFNILSGRIFRVGDRIEMGGVRGDVIDITPLRTKLLEMGSTTSTETWVHGRQHTGRIVAVSNRMTFSAPVYNYSSNFEYIWEEMMIPVPFDADWELAERIVLEEAQRVSSTSGALEALAQMARRYPIPRTELEPRVYTRVTDGWIEMSARFMVPVRTGRGIKDDMTRCITQRFAESGIEFSTASMSVTVQQRGPKVATDTGDADNPPGATDT